jgi:hypothetical protein
MSAVYSYSISPPNQGRSLAQGLRGFLGLDEWSCFSELAFLPGISCKTKIDSDRNIKTGSQYFLGVDLLLNQSSPVPEVAWKRPGRQSP